MTSNSTDINAQMREIQFENKKEQVRKKSALTIQGYQIPKELLTKEDIDKVRNEITFQPKVAQSVKGLAKEIPVCSYKETSKYIYLPKVYGIETFGIPPPSRILYKGIEVQAKFAKTLRPIQKEAFDTLFSHIRDQKNKLCGTGGIISLPTGYGKTVLAIAVICELKTKTLIIAHKDFLIEQWYDSIVKFSDIKPEEIGLIKGKTCDIENKKVILASLQSVSMKEYPPKTFIDIGLTIIDEAHHIGSEVFSQALPKVSAKYMIGLSATPDRKDGLETVFKQFIGDCIFKVNMEPDSQVQVKIFVFRSRNPEYTKEIKMTATHFNVSKMINNVANFHERNQQIITLLKTIIEQQPERKILLLSERKSQLNYINEALSGHNIECGLYFSGISKKVLAENLNKKVILATIQMVSEGFDLPSLNTLFIATPKVEITQIVGRILRTPKEQRKVIPMIVDIFDTINPFLYYNRSRENYYVQKGYNVQFINEKRTVKKPNKNIIDKPLHPTNNGAVFEHLDEDEEEILLKMRLYAKDTKQ